MRQSYFYSFVVNMNVAFEKHFLFFIEDFFVFAKSDDERVKVFVGQVDPGVSLSISSGTTEAGAHYISTSNRFSLVIQDSEPAGVP